MADLRFERVPLDQVPWDALDACPDRVVCQTRGWLGYLRDTQRAEPVVARLLDGSREVGWFTGAVVRKAGLRVLGSPFPGWLTFDMGFNLQPGVARRDALAALRRFGFGPMGCWHVEIRDRYLTSDDAAAVGWDVQPGNTILVDLAKPEEALMKGLDRDVRRCVRRAEEQGVQVVEADDEAFFEEHYQQLLEVFGKQGMSPLYERDRLVSLWRNLRGTGRLLLLRGLTPEGECASTGVFAAMNDTMYWVAYSSWQKHQALHVNDLLQWRAMLHWSRLGITRYDMAGWVPYKMKFGGVRTDIYWLRCSRLPWLSRLREPARRFIRAYRLRHGVGKD